MNITVFGLGSMGGMIAECILQSNDPSRRLTVVNRSQKKLDDFSALHPGVQRTSDFVSAAKDADVVFLCVLPLASYEILSATAPHFHKDAIIVSVVSDLSVSTISTLFRGKVLRIVPTVTTKVKRGITLLSKNDLVSEQDIQQISALFGGSIHFRIILDSQINLLTGITSCGPGIISGLLDHFIESFCNGHFPKDEIRDLVIETVMSTCILSNNLNMSFKDIIAGVATRGGITEAALSVLENSLPPLFNTMTETMQNRHRFRSEKVSAMFTNPPL